MINLVTCIFIGITTLLIVGKWIHSISLKIRKRRIKKCGSCKMRIYWWQPSKTLNGPAGYWYEHLKCYDEGEKCYEKVKKELERG